MDYITIEDVNDASPNERTRFDDLLEHYVIGFGTKPNYVICAPGRVNLIGDHIDYHGFSVLPMAIEKSIWIACGEGSSGTQQGQYGDGQDDLHISNCQQETYPHWSGRHSLAYGRELDRKHSWHNYVLCGYHGALVESRLSIDPEHIFEHSKSLTGDKLVGAELECKIRDLRALCLMVQSTLPAASGLSSSSALVCASAIATLLDVYHSQSILEPSPVISRTMLARSCSKYEHLIGTRGGGMDQAVIMTAQRGFAKHVQFVPSLKCDNVMLPDKAVWLVAHCGREYPKAATIGFNRRVLETQLGAAFIAKSFGYDVQGKMTLGEVKQRFFHGLECSDIIAKLRDEIFSQCNTNSGTFSADQVCQLLGLKGRQEMKDIFMVNDDELLEGELHLLRRCEHVFEEAHRVEQFNQICNSSDANLVALGKLMTDSHYSLKNNYECSSEALDRLVEIALSAGAYGSRLTGAGWAGCTVSLVDEARCDQVERQLAQVSKFTFRTKPQSGLRIFKIDL